MTEGRHVSRNELVKDVPKDKQQDLDYLVDLIDWPANTDTHFKKHHFLPPVPVADTASEGYVDTWVVYGKVEGRQLFSANELTLQPGVKCTIKDTGAYGLIVTEGHGRIGKLALECPSMIRFGQLTEDEVFVSYEAASAGVTFENHSNRESLVVLRAFVPDANPAAPDIAS